jgi:pseudouridine kinase
VVCAGGVVVDRKFHLAAASVAGTSNPAEVSTSAGGVARNVAENLAGLLTGPGTGPGVGVGVEVVSAIGDDDAGAMLLAGLSRRGIGVRHIRVWPGDATAQYVAVLEPGGDLTIGAAAMAVLDRIDVAALDAAWPDDGWLFCDGNLPADVLAHVLTRARGGSGAKGGSGAMVVIDAVSTRKVTRLPADLRGLALLCCNRDEARAWLAHHGRDRCDSPSLMVDDVSLARRVQAAGAAAVLLTRGSAGLVVVEGESVTEIPAVAAVPVDVTGAGDALIAGTLAALIAGAGLPAAARAGAERAARTVESRHSVLPPLGSGSEP